MARLIPAVIDPATQSPGERDLFKRFRDDPGTDGWTIFHSFNLPAHVTQVEGELDFVVLVPGQGMLCLEVKAHHRVERGDDGLWRLGNTPPTPRSPFKQAADGMRSLMATLRQRRRAEADALVVWHAVVFTGVAFSAQNVEWRAWEVIDQRDLHRAPISELVLNVLHQARRALPSKALEGVPTEQECATIVAALRPSFEVVQTPALRRRAREDELVAFTAEQYAALDALEANERVVYSGPAGTGKTVLALEAARREALDGQRILLLCFNRLLGEWISAQARALNENIRAATLHGLMRQVAQIEVPADPPPDWFAEELPARATEVLLYRDDPVLFDVIVADEAQDVLRDSYLDFLDVALSGGLAAGRWRFFGDFERQALFGSADVPLDDFLSARASAARYRLSVNCRNTRRIADFVCMLSGLTPGYSRVLRDDDGPDPRMRHFDSERAQVSALTAALEELYAEGFGGDEIMILSPRRDGCCARQVSEQPWRDRIKEYRPDPGGQFVRYTTIQAFKGLEAPSVIVTDIHDIVGQRAESLFYTALSRATDRLIVLADDVVAPDAVAAVQRYAAEKVAHG